LRLFSGARTGKAKLTNGAANCNKKRRDIKTFELKEAKLLV